MPVPTCQSCGTPRPQLRATMYRAMVRHAQLSSARPNSTTRRAPAHPPTAPGKKQMLGYANFRRSVAGAKMAESVPQVLALPARPGDEGQTLRRNDVTGTFARATRTKLNTLEPWDVAFASEKLLQARYAFSEQEGEAVLHRRTRCSAALFRVVESLFGVRLNRTARRSGTRTYASSASRRRMAADWTVLHRPLRARDEARRRLDGRGHHAPARSTAAASRRQSPIISCNFSRPVGDKPGDLQSTTT